jgi:heme/copper-type cytochrome/quinol oxidase subunit 3
MTHSRKDEKKATQVRVARYILTLSILFGSFLGKYYVSMAVSNPDSNDGVERCVVASFVFKRKQNWLQLRRE